MPRPASTLLLLLTAGLCVGEARAEITKKDLEAAIAKAHGVELLPGAVRFSSAPSGDAQLAFELGDEIYGNLTVPQAVSTWADKGCTTVECFNQSAVSLLVTMSIDGAEVTRGKISVDGAAYRATAPSLPVFEWRHDDSQTPMSQVGGTMFMESFYDRVADALPTGKHTVTVTVLPPGANGDQRAAPMATGSFQLVITSDARAQLAAQTHRVPSLPEHHTSTDADRQQVETYVLGAARAAGVKAWAVRTSLTWVAGMPDLANPNAPIDADLRSLRFDGVMYQLPSGACRFAPGARLCERRSNARSPWGPAELCPGQPPVFSLDAPSAGSRPLPCDAARKAR